MGTRLLVLSGGDPLNRPDLEDLAAYGHALGLRVATIPAATPALTQERLRSLKTAGVEQIALSLDAPNAEEHDEFRRFPGAYGIVMKAAGWAKAEGIPLQINTCFGAWNIGQIEKMAELVRLMGAVFWEVFFLVSVGRGAELQGISAQDFESAFARLAAIADRKDFVVKLTEAQHYRRYLALAKAKSAAVGGRGLGALAGSTGQAVNSGKGFLFVDYRGKIYPSGFLPIPAGDARQDDVASVYRGSELFRMLRDFKNLKGKCGRCEFSAICSGSRARAYAATGDILGEDPSCLYAPGSRRNPEVISA